ncbi:MAG TPA: YARHG domain-containing protein [Pyrinomonadaceae bacterium]|nr:YARHG domain-containing protein [Pyrinomonadaceae bacterium]
MINNLPPFRTALTVIILIVGASVTGVAQDSMQRWENFDFTQTALKSTDISKLPLQDLKLMRGIIFGRHGRVFKDADIQFYLKDKTWFHPNPEFNNSMLNDVERRNLDLVRDGEASKHDFVQPGDMRYWRKRVVSNKQLGQHSSAEWLVLRSEIEAIHGKRFQDEPWLQQYFDERYWYKPSDHYDPKKLTDIERKNLETIAAAQKLKRGLALSPGDMEFFENKPISEQMLRGLSLYELRLLRNEIYARHGRQFQAQWLQQYFYGQAWYTPDENFKDEELSGFDKQNVETIVAYENRVHQELSTRPITRSLLEGLFVEDASKMRQEIYARRGKVFKEPWFQTYFASFDWYKPNPDFTDAQLTAVEKRNIATIAAYEKKAVSAMSVIEG